MRAVSATVLPAVFVIVACIVACAIMAVPARAQSAPLPGYDPRQAERKFDAAQSDQHASLPPLRAPRVNFAKAGSKSSGDPRPLFVLRTVSVDGAQAIAPNVTARAYQAYLGKKVSRADLTEMANAISEAYRRAGFHLSRAIVPPQDVVAGSIRVQAIEGIITELVVTGEGAETFGVRAALEPVLAESPARLDTLQWHLLLLNDRPGLRIVDTQLEEIGTATGRFRLIVQTQTWRVYLSAGLDNLGSASVGPWQAYSTAAFNSLAVAGDTLAVNVSTIPTDPSELKFARLAYEVPIGIDGIRIGGSAFHSDVRPGDERRQFDTRTRTDSAEVHASVVALKSQTQSLTLTLGAAITDAASDDVGGSIYHDRVRTLGLSADYLLKDRFNGTNYLTVGIRQGLNMFGASQSGDDFLSRNDASGQFTAINAWYTRLQPLNDAWSVKFAGAGQFASAPMLLSQQFYLGGAAFGRGYGGAEISGDNAVAGAMEIRFDQAVNFAYLSGYQLYGFFDTGAVWNYATGLSDGVSLASVGAGIRLNLRDQLQLGLALAKPLTYAAPDNPDRSLRFLFSVTDALKLCPGQNRMTCS